MRELDYRVQAVSRYVPMSPRKIRLVLDRVRGKGATEALAVLRFMPQRAALSVSKLIRSAASNAEDRYGLGLDELYIARIQADEGSRMKRYRVGARARMKPILKRSSHITVVLGLRQEA